MSNEQATVTPTGTQSAAPTLDQLIANAETAQKTEQANADTADLSKFKRIKFEDKEMTFDELKKSMMLQKDYTQKTQKISDSAKYAESTKQYVDNLAVDMDNVLTELQGNPTSDVVARFKQIYPAEFHSVLDRYLTAMKVAPKTAPVEEFQKKIERMERFVDEQQHEKANLQLDNLMSKLSPKYPMADESLVLHRAQMALERGEQLTPEVWEKIFKDTQAYVSDLSKKYEKQRLEELKAKHRQASDTGKGGGTPGEGPKKETLKQVGERMQQDLAGRKF